LEKFSAFVYPYASSMNSQSTIQCWWRRCWWLTIKLRTGFFILNAMNALNITRQILIVRYYLGPHLPDGLYSFQVIQPKFCVHLSFAHTSLFYMYRLSCNSSCNRLTDCYFRQCLSSQAFPFRFLFLWNNYSLLLQVKGQSMEFTPLVLLEELVSKFVTRHLLETFIFSLYHANNNRRDVNYETPKLKYF
jgi:hypothetical protein